MKRHIPKFLNVSPHWRLTRRKMYVSVTIFSFVLLILLTISVDLSRKVNSFSFARSDSETWNFVQVEVELHRLQLALAQALMETQDGSQISDETHLEIETRFDIFYARVDTVAQRLRTFPVEQDARDALSELTTLRDKAAIEIDAGRLKTVDDVRAIFDLIEYAATLSRIFALSALQSAIDSQEERRSVLHSSLNNYLFYSLVLIGLLLLSFISVVFLLRRIATTNLTQKKLSSYLAKLLEVSHDAIIVMDCDFKVIEFNAAAEAMFGCQRKEAYGQSVLKHLTPKKSWAPFEKQLRIMFARKESGNNALHRSNVRARRFNGETFPASLSIVRETGMDGQPVLIGFVRDTSQEWNARLKARTALARARSDASAKSRFLATMSHEMRTPLHGVVAALDLAETETEAVKRREYIQISRDAAATALEQIDDVLDIARHDAMSSQLTPQPYNPRNTVQQICEQLEALAKSKGNALTLNWRGPDENIGYRRAFSNAIYNLISNAIKFTNAGSITVLGTNSLVNSAWETRIEVIDTGIGISQADQARIFEDFYSLSDEVAPVLPGTGLGLGIVQRSVEFMGGTITLESTLGSGSRFCFTIPSFVHDEQNDAIRVPSSAQQEQSEDDMPANIPLGKMSGRSDRTPNSTPAPDTPTREDVKHTGAPKGHVLLVEDHPTNRTLLKAMAEQIGYDVDTAIDGFEAVQKACETVYDLILTDLNMPNMSGLDASSIIRLGSRSSKACIIAVTAQASMKMEETLELFESGIDSILHKPFTMHQLRSHIEKVISERDAMDDVEQQEEFEFERLSNPLPSFEENPNLVELTHRAKTEVETLGDMLRGMLQNDPGAKDLDEIAQFSHFVAGSLLFLGYPKLGRLLGEIEKCCRKAEIVRLQGLAQLLLSKCL